MTKGEVDRLLKELLENSGISVSGFTTRELIWLLRHELAELARQKRACQ